MEEYGLMKFKHRIKVVVSTKQALFEDRVNAELEKLEEEGNEIFDIDTNISYAGKEGYQIMACIKYLIPEEKNGVLDNVECDPNLDFGLDSDKSQIS